MVGNPCHRSRQRDRTLLSEGLRSGRHRGPGNSYFPGPHLISPQLLTWSRLPGGARLDPMPVPIAGLRTDDPVWYVAYGSNLSRERFRAYLEGGRPAGSQRHYSGGRDTTPPHQSRVLRLGGRLVFAGISTVWGGGLAFLDPDGEGEVVAR